jgi:hypothetical protein
MFCAHLFVFVKTAKFAGATKFSRFGQLGLGHCEESVCVPTVIPALANANIKEIACGQLHTLVLLEDGRVGFCICVYISTCMRAVARMRAAGR